MSQSPNHPAIKRLLLMLLILLLGPAYSACAKVDTILLTNDTFPPKGSPDEVVVLEQMPTRPHQEIAELRIGDSWLSFGGLQHKILTRAAALGADAVVFAKPQTVTQHEVSYQPLYSPWGYYSPYYATPWGFGGYGGYGGYGGPFGLGGPWGGAYGGSIAVPYDETMRLLMGTAIRYTGTAGFNGHNRSSGVSLQQKRINRLELAGGERR